MHLRYSCIEHSTTEKTESEGKIKKRIKLEKKSKASESHKGMIIYNIKLMVQRITLNIEI